MKHDEHMFPRPCSTLVRRATRMFSAVILAAVPTRAPAVTITLDFASLPSMQEPSGPNWTYLTLNSRTETEVFHVGPNAGNEPTLFQDTMGVGFPCCDANRYQLSDVLDPLQRDFNLHVRAAVLAEELHPISPNHFGFTFAVVYAGSGIEVGIGTSEVQVADSVGNRILATGLDNTGYHDYVLCGTVGPSGAWTLSRDGAVIGTGSFYSSSANILLLGDGSAGGNTRTEVTTYTFLQAPPQLVVQKTTFGTEVSWQPLGPGVTYDLVRGDLDVLRSSGGDFTAALDAIVPGTDVCMANDTTTASVLDTRFDPPSGDGWFYLRRCVASTYNSGGPSQQGDRDSEIASSANACP